MAAEPYINLFIGDVYRESQSLSIAAFGGYMKLVFLAHDSPTKGVITYTLEQLARVFACPLLEAKKIIEEITAPQNQIFDCSLNGEQYVLTYRKMVRENAIKQSRREAGAKGGRKTQAKNQRNENLVFDFTLSNDTNFAKANVEQITGIDNDIGNDNGNAIEEKGGVGEKETPVVWEMLQVWKQAKPHYPVNEKTDLPALCSLVKFIAEKAGIRKDLAYFTEAERQTVIRQWRLWCSHLRGHPTLQNHSLETINRFKTQQIFQEISDGKTKHTYTDRPVITGLLTTAGKL